MCFGLGSSKPPNPGPFPPRRHNYGDDYDKYLRDVDKYQKAKKEYQDWSKKRSRRNLGNGNIGALGAGIAVAGGGGGA